MEEAIIIGVDLAKNVFQLHGAGADGSVVFRKKLSRVQFHKFMAEHPPSTVVNGGVWRFALLGARTCPARA